jgi:hypothetical protein
MHKTQLLALALIGGAALAGCSKHEAPAPAAPAAAPAAAAEAAAPADLTSRPAPEGAKVFFAELKDGAEVSSPVLVKFGVSGIEIAPAGEDKPNSGHHHLVIDADLPPANAPVPSNEHNLHFGKGQTEASIELTPGKHTLQLTFADYRHVPFNPPLASDKITITVK